MQVSESGLMSGTHVEVERKNQTPKNFAPTVCLQSQHDVNIGKRWEVKRGDGTNPKFPKHLIHLALEFRSSAGLESPALTTAERHLVLMTRTAAPSLTRKHGVNLLRVWKFTFVF